jgi:hypothetical protein
MIFNDSYRPMVSFRAMKLINVSICRIPSSNTVGALLVFNIVWVLAF